MFLLQTGLSPNFTREKASTYLLKQTSAHSSSPFPLVCVCVCVCVLFRVSPMAHVGSQAGGPIGATAAGLHHSHSNARSEPRLQQTPQLTAMLVP